jgi:hypothetical protein
MLVSLYIVSVHASSMWAQYSACERLQFEEFGHRAFDLAVPRIRLIFTSMYCSFLLRILTGLGGVAEAVFVR